VVALVRFVLDVRRRDRDAALALLGSLVDLVVGHELRQLLGGLGLGDGRRQRRLAVVDVTDRPDVHVRLVADKLLLGHLVAPPRFSVEPSTRIELVTPSLPRRCSTTELRGPSLVY